MFLLPEQDFSRVSLEVFRLVVQAQAGKHLGLLATP
jgi:hypothetical protein